MNLETLAKKCYDNYDRYISRLEGKDIREQFALFIMLGDYDKAKQIIIDAIGNEEDLIDFAVTTVIINIVDELKKREEKKA